MNLEKQQKGYDLISRSENGELRYIEVKAITSIWDGWNIKLTVYQYETGKNMNNQYWLYVVENVFENPKIYTIQNPINRIRELYFKDDWKIFSEESFKQAILDGKDVT